MADFSLEGPDVSCCLTNVLLHMQFGQITAQVLGLILLVFDSILDLLQSEELIFGALSFHAGFLSHFLSKEVTTMFFVLLVDSSTVLRVGVFKTLLSIMISCSSFVGFLMCEAGTSRSTAMSLITRCGYFWTRPFPLTSLLIMRLAMLLSLVAVDRWMPWLMVVGCWSMLGGLGSH